MVMIRRVNSKHYLVSSLPLTARGRGAKRLMATYYLTEFILIATRCPEILDYFRDPGEGRKPIAIAMLLGVA